MRQQARNVGQVWRKLAGQRVRQAVQTKDEQARARETDQPWAEAFWDADGRLRPLEVLDAEMARLHPEELREALGLPEGVEARDEAA